MNSKERKKQDRACQRFRDEQQKLRQEHPEAMRRLIEIAYYLSRQSEMLCCYYYGVDFIRQKMIRHCQEVSRIDPALQIAIQNFLDGIRHLEAYCDLTNRARIRVRSEFTKPDKQMPQEFQQGEISVDIEEAMSATIGWDPEGKAVTDKAIVILDPELIPLIKHAYKRHPDKYLRIIDRTKEAEPINYEMDLEPQTAGEGDK